MNDKEKLYQTYERLFPVLKVLIVHFLLKGTFVKFKQIDYFQIPGSCYCVETTT